MTGSHTANVEATAEALRKLRALDPAVPPSTRVWQEAELVAFEARLGVPLPAGVRAYAAEIGTGGPGFVVGGIPSFDEMKTSERARLPFPVKKAWSDPATIEEWKAEGQYTKNKSRFYPLPPGAEPTDGCLVLGATPDQNTYLLVLAGERAGTVWIDSRGVDLGGLDPAAPPEFTSLQRAWAEDAVTRAERRASIARAVRGGATDALFATAPSSEARRALERDALREACALLASGRLESGERDRALAFVTASGDDLAIGTALFAAGAFEALVLHGERVLKEPPGPALHPAQHRMVIGRAALHWVVAQAALGRFDALRAFVYPPGVPYATQSSLAREVGARVAELTPEARVEAFAKIPATIVLSRLGEHVDAGALPGLLDRLLVESAESLAATSAARDASQAVVTRAEKRGSPLGAESAERLARVFAFVGVAPARFEELAACSGGALGNGEEASRRGTAHLIANEAAFETPYARQRLEEVAKGRPSK